MGGIVDRSHPKLEICSGVVKHILDYVSIPDFITACRVSKVWREGAQSNPEQTKNTEIFQGVVKHLFMGAVEYRVQRSWPFSWLSVCVNKVVAPHSNHLNLRVRHPTNRISFDSFDLNLYQQNTGRTFIKPQKQTDEIDLSQFHHRGDLTVSYWLDILSDDSEYKIGLVSKTSSPPPCLHHVTEIANEAKRYVMQLCLAKESGVRTAHIGRCILGEIASQTQEADLAKKARRILDGVNVNKTSEEQIELISTWQKKIYKR